MRSAVAAAGCAAGAPRLPSPANWSTSGWIQASTATTTPTASGAAARAVRRRSPSIAASRATSTTAATMRRRADDGDDVHEAEVGLHEQAGHADDPRQRRQRRRSRAPTPRPGRPRTAGSWRGAARRRTAARCPSTTPARPTARSRATIAVSPPARRAAHAASTTAATLATITPTANPTEGPATLHERRQHVEPQRARVVDRPAGGQRRRRPRARAAGGRRRRRPGSAAGAGRCRRPRSTRGPACGPWPRRSAATATHDEAPGRSHEPAGRPDVGRRRCSSPSDAPVRRRQPTAIVTSSDTAANSPSPCSHSKRTGQPASGHGRSVRTTSAMTTPMTARMPSVTKPARRGRPSDADEHGRRRRRRRAPSRARRAAPAATTHTGGGHQRAPRIGHGGSADGEPGRRARQRHGAAPVERRSSDEARRATASTVRTRARVSGRLRRPADGDVDRRRRWAGSTSR